MDTIEQLRQLYSTNSKHSNYQIIPDRLSVLIGNDQIDVKSRFERERLDYILKNVDIKGKRVLDIGGNSGFFTFEAIDRGAATVHYYEGNKAHSRFVELAADVLDCADRVEVTSGYYAFETDDSRTYDVVLLLNVLHHFGDDYGDAAISIEAAKQLMMAQLITMAKKSSAIVFQLGFCWKGDRRLGLFEKGTKKELIDFIRNAVSGVWDIQNIGVPVRRGHHIQYLDVDDKNIARDDSLGEFLNRPLFVMKSGY